MEYRIYNFRTGQFVSAVYKSRKRANNRANKLDLEYGAITCRVVEIRPS